LQNFQSSYFLLGILCIYISNVILFPSSLLSLAPPLLLWGCSTFHPPLPPPPWHFFPLHWEEELTQDHRPLLLLMPDNDILCYIWGWSHGSLHVYSLIDGLDSGSSGGFWWCCCSSYGVANPFSSFSPFSNSSFRDSVLILTVSCKHSHLYH